MALPEGVGAEVEAVAVELAVGLAFDFDRIGLDEVRLIGGGEIDLYCGVADGYALGDVNFYCCVRAIEGYVQVGADEVGVVAGERVEPTGATHVAFAEVIGCPAGLAA